jgi:hypothetical protein
LRVCLHVETCHGIRIYDRKAQLAPHVSSPRDAFDILATEPHWKTDFPEPASAFLPGHPSWRSGWVIVGATIAGGSHSIGNLKQLLAIPAQLLKTISDLNFVFDYDGGQSRPPMFIFTT